MGRLVIVSNRLPITIRLDEDRLQFERSAGGLATGLAGPHEQSGGLWIGWTGLAADLDEAHREELDERLAESRLQRVPLSGDEIERYYEGVCNGVIWPLFHYLVDQLPLQIRDFAVYEAVNERFADIVAARALPGDTIWVQDYQLMLVPALLRRRLPDARIGFFLHIPFPSSELFRILPFRQQLLEGLLGADLIGFHTASYMRHFLSCALRVLGVSTGADRVEWQGRPVRVGVFPMGIDAATYDRQAREAEVVEQAAVFRGENGVQVLVGIDRLDYTKGIPLRLLAFERLLDDHADLRGRVRLIQVAVPSRTNVAAYQDFRTQVDGLIGRIHGAFATPTWTPIHYLYRGLAEREVVALYRAADVMLVTPIRDGMNLVAKEFIASRPDEDGVLVLSEFAGAASELAEAIHVNPYDVEGTADAYLRALTMPAGERRERMRGLRLRVIAYDVHRWVRTFLGELERPDEARDSHPRAPTRATEPLVGRVRAAASLVLLLDYDGTLVPFAQTPELAAPDARLLGVLRRLADRPGTQVHIVSGRRRETLDRWLGELPLWLHAEHGLWSREPGTRQWRSLELPEMKWREAVLKILEDFAARTPGSLVEEKTASLAWHYRMADPEYGSSQANELKLHLATLLSNEPVELLSGAKVIEIRPYGIHKGRLVPPILAAAPPQTLIVAMGDDRTDEDLFAALPPEAVAIHVGAGDSTAAIRLGGVHAARMFLGSLIEPA
jgi:trehalose 6-phosphate synthase/phosphatase